MERIDGYIKLVAMLYVFVSPIIALITVVFIFRCIGKNRRKKKNEKFNRKSAVQIHFSEGDNVKQKQEFNPSYYKKRITMWDSPIEKLIYNQLLEITPNRLAIIPHVSLIEIFASRRGRRDYMLTQSHIDYLVCDKDSLAPILGIEFDGKYHNDEEQANRDRRKDELFKFHQIELMRINYQNYQSGEVINMVIDKLKKIDKVYCAMCGSEMRLVEGKNGMSDFLGCTAYSKTGCSYKRDKNFTYIEQ